MFFKDLTDIHCHLMPYVDDGADTLCISKKLIDCQIEQGVKNIYLTPHLREDIFMTPDIIVKEQFERLNQYVLESKKDVNLYLSREYHCDELLLKNIENNSILPLSKDNHILLEFSRFHSAEYIVNFTKKVADYGYKPVIVHIERYPVFQERNLTIACKLLDLGAMFQINTDTVLGKRGLKQKFLAKYFLKENIVHFIASDSHGLDVRTPNLGHCAKYLKKRISENQHHQIFFENPKLLKHILGEKEYAAVNINR